MLYWYLRQHVKPHIYGPGYRGLLKQGFNEAAGITLFLLGAPFGLLGLFIVYQRHRIINNDKRRYVIQYTIYRDDDPRLCIYAHPPKQQAEVTKKLKDVKLAYM